MTDKYLISRSLAVLTALSQLFFSPTAMASTQAAATHEAPQGTNHVQVNIEEPLHEALYEYGDLGIDAIIEQELKSTPFAQRELFSFIIKAGMRRNSHYPHEYIHDELLPNILKEEFTKRLKAGGQHNNAEKIEFAHTMYLVTNIFLKVQLALISHQIMRLNPFIWPTPERLFENQEMIANTNKELSSWNKNARLPNNRLSGRLFEPANHSFTLGPAYRQLLDINRNGWDRSLNWETGDSPFAGMLNGRSDNEISQAESDYVEDFSDINAGLKDAVASSDEAMDQFKQDVESNGTNKLLEATATENVQMTDRMNKLENQTIKANVKSLAIGVMLGAAGTAFGMALQSSPAMRFGSYGHSSPTSSFSSSGASHVIRAPSIGGSFDGAAGQTLFTRF